MTILGPAQQQLEHGHSIKEQRTALANASKGCPIFRLVQAFEKELKHSSVFLLVAPDFVVIRMGLNVENSQWLGNKADSVAESGDVHRIPITTKLEFGHEIPHLAESACLENHTVWWDVEFALS